MSPNEMYKACLDQIEIQKKYNFADAHVVFTIPKGQTPKRFIRGKLILENIVDGVFVNVYRYDAYKLINWLKKNNLIKGDENERYPRTY